MPAIANLIHETSTTTGTGDFTLAAVNGKVRFSDSSHGFDVGGTDAFYYFISNRAAAEWEIGTGHMSDADTLVRDTVLASSNSDAAVNFSAGTKDVANDIPAGQQVSTEGWPASRDELKALPTEKYVVAHLRETGREGTFIFKVGDYSTHIAADPEEGVYIKADSVDADQGVWVRDHTPGIYDVRWFGAVGDGSTDDRDAIQACIDFASATYGGKPLTGGTVFVPVGMFKCGSGLLVDAMYVKLEGVGERSIIFTSADGFDLLTVQEQLCDVKGLSLWNTVPAASHSVLKLNTGAVQCRFEKLALAGGKHCIEMPEGPVDNTFRHVVAQNAWGGATALVRGGTAFFYRCLFNQQWPAGAPTANSQDKGNHATNTSYSVGDYVVRSSRYLQCMAAGMSGGTAPNLTGVGYQQNISDGEVTWQIAGVHNAFAMLIETGAHYVTCEDCDFTGPFLNSVTVRNSFGGIAPDEIRFDRCTSAGCISGGFFNYAGRRVFYDRCECQAYYSQSTTVSYYVHSTFAGDVEFVGCSTVTPIQYGYFLGHGAGGTAVVRGSNAHGCTTAGAYAAAGVTNFNILDNDFGSSDIWGGNATAIRVETGASDYYKIALNRVRGSTAGVSDGGSGSNKYLAGNI